MRRSEAGRKVAGLGYGCDQWVVRCNAEEQQPRQEGLGALRRKERK